MKPGDYIEVNLGSKNEPKMIKIGKGTLEKERNDLINLVKELLETFTTIHTHFGQFGLVKPLS